MYEPYNPTRHFYHSFTSSNWKFSLYKNILNMFFELLIYVERIDNAGSDVDDDRDDD